MTTKTGFLQGPSCDEPDAVALVRDILARVGDKWTLMVVDALSREPMRFTRLMDEVPGISHRMLTRTLRALERDGIVSRTAFAEVPPRVEYALTPLGDTLTEPVLGFVRWVDRNRHEVEANRAAFDA
ncbi:helix-turn-helix domain-containing protein [Okibacterium endophyticum]